MAHAYYNLQWQKAMEELSELLDIENPPVVLDSNDKPIPLKPITWNDAYKHYALLYIKYIGVARKLEECYDQMVHPQKRRDIRVTLDVVLARISQLKANINTFGPGGRQSDFPNFDNFLLSLKLAPQDLDIPIPRYFRERRFEDEEVTNKRLILARCMDELGISSDQPAQAQPPSNTILLTHMTREMAITIIQRNERGRQATVKAKLLKELKDEDSLRVKSRMGIGLDRDPHTAATIIQRCVRGYLSRLRTKAEEQEELIFLGMAPPPPPQGGAYDPVAKEAQVRKNRKTRQADNELQYVESLVELEQEVTNTIGPELKDALWTERYEWWLNEKQRTGKGPKTLQGFYDMVAEKNKPPVDPEVVAMREEEAKKAAEAARRAKRGGAVAAKATKPKEKDNENNNKLVLTPSDLIAPITETIAKYKEVWCTVDESSNISQVHDDSIARAKLIPEVREQLTQQVDTELLTYLQNIQAKAKAAMKKKKKKEVKKPEDDGVAPAEPVVRPSATTAGKTDGAKTGKPKKKKKWIEGEKACSQMSLSAMIVELLRANILQDTQQVCPLSSYLGEVNYVGSSYESSGVSIDPTMAQLRQTLTDLYILPQGCSYVKEHSQPRSSLLLYGPRGSGKTMLAKSIAYETQSLWFDLSPSNIGKFATKTEIQKLCYMVFKVAVELQPAVIYVDDAEFIWSTAKSKGKNASPAACLRASLVAQRKHLPPTARVLIVGNSRQPFAPKASVTEMCKFFDYQHNGKMFYVPAPNYPTRVMLWKHFIEQSGMPLSFLSQSPSFNVSSLAFVTEGFTAGAIEMACQNTFTVRRVERLLQSSPKKFDVNELLRTLSKTTYTYQQEYVNFANFTFLVTGEKARLKIMQAAMMKEAELKAQAQKKQGLKKKPSPSA